MPLLCIQTAFRCRREVNSMPLLLSQTIWKLDLICLGQCSATSKTEINTILDPDGTTTTDVIKFLWFNLSSWCFKCVFCFRGVFTFGSHLEKSKWKWSNFNY